MPDRTDGEAGDRTNAGREPDRIDSNEKADDRATVVDPDGTDVVETIPEEEGRSSEPRDKRPG